ncbi:MAG: FAD-dependent oxidoreductase [Kiritimatiellaeota bacterium]|nr:FAD-dependent oxidoreductase [Kiritimatiellota bacterium]
MPKTIGLAPHQGTVLWEGDAIVVGATLPGVCAAVQLTARGLRTCLIESGPVLGREVSGAWLDRVPPDNPVCNRLLRLCREQGGSRGDRVDPFVAALAFDRIVEEAGLPALVRIFPVRTLVDAHNRPRGLEVVGRSGRHLMRAPRIVDATPAHTVARAALGLPPADPRVTRRARFAGVGPLPPAGLDITVLGRPATAIPAVWKGECILSLAPDLPDALPESQAALLTYRCLLDAAAELRSSHEAFRGANLVAVAPEFLAEYPDDSEALAPLADTALTPLPWGGDLQARIRQALDVCTRMPADPSRLRPIPVSHGQAPPENRVETCELRTDPARDLETVQLPPATAQLHEPCDVVVAGYGTGGAFAALAAAEHQLKVVALDPAPYPGGMGSAGNIHAYYHGVPGGMQDRLDEQISRRGAAIAADCMGYHPAARAGVLLDHLEQKHVTLLPGHIAIGVVKKGTAVRGVLSVGPDGYHLFPCRIAVDATGDGDLAAAAGAEFAFGREGDGFPQPYSYTPTILREGRLWHRNFDAGWVDPTDTLDFSRAHFEGRRRLWDHGPFTQEQHYCTLAAILGVRESRFIRGNAMVRFEDFLRGRTWPDAVCEMRAHYDNHAIDYGNESAWARRHVTEFGLWRYHCQGAIPLRTLIPRGLDGLLVACRALSVDHDMHQLARMQRDMQKIGEIAGHTAALSVLTGVEPAELGWDELQTVFAEAGLPIPAEPQPQAAVSSDELLDMLDTESAGIAMWRLSRLPPEAAPDWKRFFAQSHPKDKAFRAAVAAALGGHVEAARPTLEQVVAERRREPILGEKAPPAFVVAAMALAEVQAPDSTDRLGTILLEAPLDPPTILLILKGIELAGDPRGADYVRRFVEATRDNSFSMPLWGCSPEWRTSFRFAIELRAEHTVRALGASGNDESVKRYTNHENLLVRRYARRLLALGRGLPENGADTPPPPEHGPDLLILSN